MGYLMHPIHAYVYICITFYIKMHAMWAWSIQKRLRRLVAYCSSKPLFKIGPRSNPSTRIGHPKIMGSPEGLGVRYFGPLGKWCSEYLLHPTMLARVIVEGARYGTAEESLTRLVSRTQGPRRLPCQLGGKWTSVWWSWRSQPMQRTPKSIVCQSNRGLLQA